MKKIAWIFSLILCLATFWVSPSAQADVTPAQTSAAVAIDETGEIWKLSSPTFTSQGGSVYHGAYAEPKIWNLLNGSGERKFITHVYFEEPYQKPPTVIVSLTGMDVSNVSNLRIMVSPINITETGFDLELQTWADSQIVSLWSNWTAFGNNG
ncbi:MAG TPA: hypothetical protein DEG17_16565 [Cyanobacteria bacterium UBA11149]|nr:hypothetical protein [Cyanobacteria bacterium UBA11367]HBE59910.1 hypothetical protein [Cyanobacteria bacterium UBA11366]HBK64707.1 hypothetical protein [Cyanobacteria bacterium UBA11166]HBR75866.1 hypothetical protein [Cyanobacteria bacterium UBA11159]HBS69288.1 hypothetical protein [Cyanobacteria bacterium UBA11153]HBW90435.1 hypothetical protein [Cyanobacteria bacterium UBA11149]HCA96643.1 hypothetical protein [Cyanobacteria bacterium UBA9226]